MCCVGSNSQQDFHSVTKESGEQDEYMQLVSTVALPYMVVLTFLLLIFHSVQVAESDANTWFFQVWSRTWLTPCDSIKATHKVSAMSHGEGSVLCYNLSDS